METLALCYYTPPRSTTKQYVYTSYAKCRVPRKTAFTKVRITLNDDDRSKTIKLCATVRRAKNIECAKTPRRVSREAPARVRITGNIFRDIDEIDGREEFPCVAA